MPLTAARLLARLDTQSHAQRVHAMVELGRQSLASAEARGVIAALFEGEWYPRRLALVSCFGSRDGAMVLEALADASASLRGLATVLVASVLDDAQASLAFERLGGAQRLTLCRRLARAGRRAPVDALVERLVASGDAAAPDLLAFASPALVARHWPTLEASAGWVARSRVARQHPDVALQALQARAAAAAESDPLLTSQANTVLGFAGNSRPVRAAGLATALARHTPLSSLALGSLARRHPAAVAALMLERREAPAAVSLARGASRLSDAQLVALVTDFPAVLGMPLRWLRPLPPERRVTVFAACPAAFENGAGRIDADVLALLPAAWREPEARRHHVSPLLAAQPAVLARYAALLPVDEAEQALAAWLRDPDAELRAIAVAAWVSAARYHRDRLATWLAFGAERKNEQDPVRQAMLAAFADLSPGLWQTEHLAGLGGLLSDALAARDLSVGTVAAMQRLLAKLIGRHSAWAAGWIATLLRAQGYFPFDWLLPQLGDADLRRLEATWLPVMREWRTAERTRQVIGAANGFGRKLHVMSGLIALLEASLAKTPHASEAAWALDTLSRWCPDRAAVLVPKLLAADASWGTQPSVYNHLHRFRQDLLTPFLGQVAHRGRFQSGRTRFVLPIAAGFHRWTAKQQAAFAATLGQLIGGQDASVDLFDRLRAIWQLSALPAVPAKALEQVARLDYPDGALRDMAIAALGRLDAGQGVPALLEALEDARARLAIYALRSTILALPKDRALAILRGVPMTRLTVSKEVVRLLGDLQDEPAYHALLAIADGPLHRDLHVACLRALREHLARPESWPYLARAARDPDPAIALAAARTPDDRLGPVQRGELLAVLTALLAHPEPRVVLGTLERLAHSPVSDPAGCLVPPLLAALGSPIAAVMTGSASALVAMGLGSGADRLAAAVRHAAGDRRALRAVTIALEAALGLARLRYAPAAGAALAALAQVPHSAIARVRLTLRSMPGAQAARTLRQMAQASELHPDALIQAASLLRADGFEWEALVAIESELSGDPEPALRRLALAALEGQGESSRGWDGDRLGRLARFREDPDAGVAEAALSVLPERELGRKP